jgi:hypothetical protein
MAEELAEIDIIARGVVPSLGSELQKFYPQAHSGRSDGYKTAMLYSTLMILFLPAAVSCLSPAGHDRS